MPDKSDAVIAVKRSIKVDVKEGEVYFWCSCGRSANQPFCDGSHGSTGFSPVMYKATESKRVGFCGCKYTDKPPVCDGAHKCL